MADPNDMLARALADIGAAPGDDPLRALDDLLRAGPVRAAALIGPLTRAVAQADEPDGRALVALGAVQLAAGHAREAREVLIEGAALLRPDDQGALTRTALRLAAAELALGDRKAARARLPGLNQVLALDDDGLLADAALVLREAGELLAAEALDALRRERRGAARGRPGERLEVLGRIVSVLNSGAAGTAEPLYAVLRAVLDESGADRGFLLCYAESTLRFELGLDRAGRALGQPDFACSMTVVDRALETGRCVVVPDLARELPFGVATSARELGIRSAMCAPLRVERKRVGASAGPSIATVRGIAGVLYVDSTSTATFGEEDGRFLEVLADCAVLALRAARAAEALRAAEAAAAQAAAQAGARRPRRPRTTSTGAPELVADGPPTRRFEGIVTRDPAMLGVLRLVERVAPTDASVLIRGESGTGKELIARALHAHGRRARGPFVAIDCGALPETLVQHELFGHEAGAFTGAGEAKAGLLERAHGGTLFLDEVGEMPPSMQAALLRVVQEGEVRRIGGDRPRQVDVRLVAASHRDLRAMVERGEFRQDLLFRLAVVELRLPPLRERLGDVPLLVEHVLQRLAAEDGRPRSIEDDALARLEEHGWSGNVRELENVLRSASLLAAGPTVTLADVDRALGQVVAVGAAAARAGAPAAPAASDAFEGTMEEIERRAIKDRLERFNWNQLQAARSLGMDRNTLHRKIVRYGIVRGR